MLDVDVTKKGPAAKAAADAKSDDKSTQKKASGGGKTGPGTSARHPLAVASRGIATVRASLLAYFRDVFVPSRAFQETFGGKSWSDVEAEITADISQFGLDSEGEIFRDPEGSVTYTGRIWTLYTEVTIDPGEEPSVYVEID